MNTFLLIDKPAGWTSFDAVAVVRKALGVKRVGHTGTLDPFATGLLLIAVGKCTKLIPYLEKDQKTYRTKIVFNKTSDTLDPEGKVIVSSQDLEINLELLKKTLDQHFTGKIEQVPPAFSALKINGQRAYDLARKGEKVELKPRSTEIHRTEILKVETDSVELEIEVAAGFYVRSLARDLAKKLGTVGMCEALRRVGVGEISIKEYGTRALNPEDLKKPDPIIPNTYYLDPREVLPQLGVIDIGKERLGDWSHGRAVKLEVEKLREKEVKAEVLVTCNDKTIGLGLLGQGSLQPKVVF